MTSWTFITNHARVLMEIVRDPKTRLRDIAKRLEITERAVQRIVTELDEEGYLSRAREGRRNVYTVHAERAMRTPQASQTEVGQVLALLMRDQQPAT